MKNVNIKKVHRFQKEDGLMFKINGGKCEWEPKKGNNGIVSLYLLACESIA